jgi:septum formation protein
LTRSKAAGTPERRAARTAPPAPRRAGEPDPAAAAPLVLASSSPRRSELLARAGLAFETMPAGVSEDPRPSEPPQALVERLATEKARAVAHRLGAVPRRVVLGSDTVVALGDAVLGKPRDAEEARAILGRLVGRSHDVWTGIAVIESDTGRTRVRSVASRVVMRPASGDEIAHYVASGEPLDKAGAYGFQGEGRRFVSRVEGSESNVIGLPIAETLALLREVGVVPAAR